jgi:hypothetical protein
MPRSQSGHDDTAGCVAHDVIRDRTKNRSLQATSTSGADHDRPCRQLGSQLTDGCAWITLKDANGALSWREIALSILDNGPRGSAGLYDLFVVLARSQLGSCMSGPRKCFFVRSVHDRDQNEVVILSEQLEPSS